MARSLGVAGITVPAFVERTTVYIDITDSHWSVAGITVPAFVERLRTACVIVLAANVSPGLRSRPSLSVYARRRLSRAAGLVSPGLRSRPSLSGVQRSAVERDVECRRDYGPGLR